MPEESVLEQVHLQHDEMQEDEDEELLDHVQSYPPQSLTDPALTNQPQSGSSRSKELFSVLSRIPLDIQEFRQRIFLLEEPATFDAQQWEKYWPLVIYLHQQPRIETMLTYPLPL
jgi:hypothetical protein